MGLMADMTDPEVVISRFGQYVKSASKLGAVCQVHIHKVHHVAPSCFSRSTEETNLTLDTREGLSHLYVTSTTVAPLYACKGRGERNGSSVVCSLQPLVL